MRYSPKSTLPIPDRYVQLLESRKRTSSRTFAGSPCIEYTGYRNKRDYGELTVRIDGKGIVFMASRLAWQLEKGPIREGYELDHLCRNPPCVNVLHLEEVTHLENVLRSDGVSAHAARRTHCPQGHRYDLLNTTYAKGGDGRPTRHCRACQWHRNHARSRKGPYTRALTDEQIRTIRARYAAGEGSTVSLGIEYGVSQALVSKIVRRELYRRVE